MNNSNILSTSDPCYVSPDITSFINSEILIKLTPYLKKIDELNKDNRKLKKENNNIILKYKKLKYHIKKWNYKLNKWFKKVVNNGGVIYRDDLLPGFDDDDEYVDGDDGDDNKDDKDGDDDDDNYINNDNDEYDDNDENMTRRKRMNVFGLPSNCPSHIEIIN